MSQPKVSMNVREVGNAICAIDIYGEVSGQAENVLADAFSRASANAKAVILNFTRLEYMNSSGIGVLVMLLIRAQRQQTRLMAYGLTDHYKQIFELTRLNEAIALFNTEEAVLAALNATHA